MFMRAATTLSTLMSEPQNASQQIHRCLALMDARGGDQIADAAPDMIFAVARWQSGGEYSQVVETRREARRLVLIADRLAHHAPPAEYSFGCIAALRCDW